MTIEENLKALMIEKSGSVNKFAHDCGLSTSTVATMFVRGVNKTNINTIIKICQGLHISADELARGNIAPVVDDSDLDLARLSETNLARLMAYYQALIDSQEGNNERTDSALGR